MSGVNMDMKLQLMEIPMKEVEVEASLEGGLRAEERAAVVAATAVIAGGGATTTITERGLDNMLLFPRQSRPGQ